MHVLLHFRFVRFVLHFRAFFFLLHVVFLHVLWQHFLLHFGLEQFVQHVNFTHLLESLGLPKHGLPKLLGAGLSHFLLLVCTPKPQLLLHFPQGPHDRHPPSTKNTEFG